MTPLERLNDGWTLFLKETTCAWAAEHGGMSCYNKFPQVVSDHSDFTQEVDGRFTWHKEHPSELVQTVMWETWSLKDGYSLYGPESLSLHQSGASINAQCNSERLFNVSSVRVHFYKGGAVVWHNDIPVPGLTRLETSLKGGEFKVSWTTECAIDIARIAKILGVDPQCALSSPAPGTSTTMQEYVERLIRSKNRVPKLSAGLQEELIDLVKGGQRTLGYLFSASPQTGKDTEDPPA